MKPIGKCDINAMELLELALEADAESDRTALIAGAPVPTAIRRMALYLLAHGYEPDQSASTDEQTGS